MSKNTDSISFYGITAVLNLLAVSVLVVVLNTDVIASKIGVQATPIFSSQKRKVKSGVPTEIRVASLSIKLPVEPGHYNDVDGSWTLNNTSTFFALPSMPANDLKGNTLIYGHNTDKVLGKLKSIELGSELEVKTDSGYIFTYIYSGEKHVTPTDTSIFTYDTAPTLTLQTCTGSWDQLRGMYTFSFKEVTKA